MKKTIVLAAGLALLAPSLAFADMFTLRFGYFMPRAVTGSYLRQHIDTSLWGIEFDQMTFAPKDFRGGIYGASYERFLGPNLSLVLGVESFSRRRLGDYYDYDQTEFDEGWFAFPTDQEPDDIDDWYYLSHSFRVSSVPVTASVKFTPLGRKTRLVPYVGGGVGAYFWSTGLYGERPGFEDPWVYTDPVLGDIDVFPVVSVNSRERGIAFGPHAFAGVQFPIGYRATIDAEARYHWAKGKFDDGFLVDFEPFELGGLSLSIGFSFWF
ncbi:MAG TPA: hypothetical protein PLP83_06535 [Candidatus Aminicenantes bacterium]|nr:hypothetical protein [Candidatus Aminicenantes bacterium]